MCLSHYLLLVTRVKVRFDRAGRFIWQSLLDEEALRPFYVGRVPSHEKGFVAVAAKEMRRQRKDDKKNDKKEKRTKKSKEDKKKKDDKEGEEVNIETRSSFTVDASVIPVDEKEEPSTSHHHHHHRRHHNAEEDEEKRNIRTRRV